MSTSAPTTGWSSTVTIATGQPGYTYTATPAAGGTVLLQWSADAVSWTSFAGHPISSTTTGGVPSAALYLRGMSFGAAGTFDATARGYEVGSAPYGTLTAAEAEAIQRTVTSGAWRGFPAVTMRLRMAGTGTVTMDSRNLAGTITSGVYSYSPSGSTFVDYAYPGDDADAIRITLTGTATCEVI